MYLLSMSAPDACNEDLAYPNEVITDWRIILSYPLAVDSLI